MNKYQLYTTATWEAAKPAGVSYSRFFYTKNSGEVRKVYGTVTVMKHIVTNGVRKLVRCARKAKWDGYGHCSIGTHNYRKRRYDIPLKDVSLNQPVDNQ
jgi:hypothetical protein